MKKTYAIGLLAVALAATACGRDSSGAAEEAQAVDTAKASGTVTVWAMGTEGEKLDAFAQKFEQANPGVTVNVTALGWDVAHDKITAAIAGDATPDVSMIGNTWLSEMVKTGAIEPTPADLVDQNAFFPSAWATGVVDGAAYGIPWYVETRAFYYRTDIVKDAKAPATWEEVTGFVKQLKDEGAELGVEQNFRTGSWQEIAPLLYQAGGDFQADGTWTLDTPQMVQALEHWGSFFKDGLAVTNQPTGAFPQTFVSGRVGAFYSGPWMITSMEQEGGESFKDKFAVAPYPKGPSGGTSLVGGSNMVVFKDKPNRAAAWKFLTWLTDPKVQAEWYTTASSLPSVQAAWQEPALTADERVQVFGAQLKDARPAPAVPTWEQVARVMEVELEKYALGKQDSAATAKRMQEQADQIGTGA
ncbi:extracellular solute-binding protein [Herbidospora daliensis]|uniref:extracellular solute-binding protein n=1 Tax=Herbidospora daliensis TaxID=295585 RepID=UPI0007850E03|nr:extracellular solute-binding protein [Herbidospora daliensis]